ncbi:hypothetical protein ACWFOS_18880 [Gordonia terrae]
MSIRRAERQAWSDRARDYVKAIERDYELTESEQVVMVELARAITRSDEITEALRTESLSVTNRFGEVVAHPYVVELRQLGGLIAKLIGALRLPDIESDGRGGRQAGKTPQKRSQPRGTYSYNSALAAVK